ncbi:MULTISPECIES: hypothetical protein [unclassified Streptomyces]|uniref:hypothetical protein n=1 Tax=Streptomyces sp. SID4926 TaxID=2690275 RepID=UPI001EF05A20|nr:MULTISPECIES: hypothetical protein [unclassified Streptomyces]
MGAPPVGEFGVVDGADLRGQFVGGVGGPVAQLPQRVRGLAGFGGEEVVGGRERGGHGGGGVEGAAAGRGRRVEDREDVAQRERVGVARAAGAVAQHAEAVAPGARRVRAVGPVEVEGQGAQERREFGGRRGVREPGEEAVEAGAVEGAGAGPGAPQGALGVGPGGRGARELGGVVAVVVAVEGLVEVLLGLRGLRYGAGRVPVRGGVPRAGLGQDFGGGGRREAGPGASRRRALPPGPVGEHRAEGRGGPLGGQAGHREGAQAGEVDGGAAAAFAQPGLDDGDDLAAPQVDDRAARRPRDEPLPLEEELLGLARPAEGPRDGHGAAAQGQLPAVVDPADLVEPAAVELRARGAVGEVGARVRGGPAQPYESEVGGGPGTGRGDVLGEHCGDLAFEGEGETAGAHLADDHPLPLPDRPLRRPVEEDMRAGQDPLRRGEKTAAEKQPGLLDGVERAIPGSGNVDADRGRLRQILQDLPHRLPFPTAVHRTSPPTTGLPPRALEGGVVVAG